MESSDRIPANKVAGLKAWSLPEVKEGQVIAVEKTRRRDSAGQLIPAGRNDVVYEEVTAGQLEDINEQIYQEIHDEAKQAGYEAGQQAGYQAGLAQGQQLIQQTVSNLNGIIASLNDLLQSQDDQTEQALVNLAVTIAGSILERELTIDSSQILTIVKECVDCLPIDTAAITISLSQQDYDLLSEHSEVLPSWKLQVDSSLTPGGCRANSQYSLIEHTLEAQFQQTVNSLVEKRFADLGKAAEQRLET